jgi:hypothetical protein
MPLDVFVDGSSQIPGCNCGLDCPMPCWQRIGTAPACDDCRCASFDSPKNATDRASDLFKMSDIWGEIEIHIPSARTVALCADHDEINSSLDDGSLEQKFRKGEAEHGRDWLTMSREQLEREILNEWKDILLYTAMIEARFGAGLDEQSS